MKKEQFLINLLLIDAKLFPQSPQFASNILRFGEEPGKLMKMLPEPNNTILMSEQQAQCQQHSLQQGSHQQQEEQHQGEQQGHHPGQHP